MFWIAFIFCVIAHGVSTLRFKFGIENVACDLLSFGREIVFWGDDKLDTKYMLFTPINPSEEQILLPSDHSVKSSSFNPKLLLKVLIHGYLANVDEDHIILKMKDALLKEGDYNVIVVDWSNNNKILYLTAIKNGQAVGRQLAQLLNIIIEKFDYKPEDIHIIGHSLGAHISGWAGERIQNLGRITGLDPAGPCFQDVKNSMRLDHTDALFVDIIHTDGGENVARGFGIADPLGHMDFYPNGGRFQTGCVRTANRDSVLAAAYNFTVDLLPLSCDHRRANEYFLESIDNSKCRFQAVWCNSYDDFEKGECLSKISTPSEMGFHAKEIEGVPVKSKFFLRTHDSSPFCIKKSDLIE